MSFRRYESCRDSGVEWLGEVPSHWPVCGLGYRYDVALGKMLDEKKISGQHLGRYLRNVDVQWGRINTEDLPEMDFSGDDLERYSLSHGDLLVCEGGEVGRAAIWPGRTEVCFYQKALHRLRRRTNCDDPRYLYYVLRAAYDADVFSAGAGKATIVHLPADAFRKHRFPFPPVGEQAAVVAFLDRETAKIDALVDAQRRLIELLKEKRQAVISHAVTKGLDPSAPTKDSGVEWLGAVPEHWEIRRVANLFGESAALLSDDLPILSVSIHNGVSDEELDEDDLERKVSRSEDRGKYKRVRPGDLVYNMMRAWQGGFGTVSVDGGVSPAYVVARPTTDIETAFVEWVLRTPQCVEEMRTHSVGVTDFRLRLYWDEFKDLKIALPPLAEQRQILAEIGEEIERYQRLAETAEAAVTLLSERRAALISAAVTGKIDVRGWTAAEVRTAVAAEIIRLHARKPTFGRVKNQKLLYLAEAHAGINEIGGRYERKAAGPYDADLIALVERDLEAAGVMTVSQPEGIGSTVSYSVNRGWKPDNERLKAMLGGRLAALEQVNTKLADLKTKDAEAVATLYAVWNDALIDGDACDDARVIRGFLDEWHPEKREKFKQVELQTWLGWMRRNGIVPGGRGPRTGTRGLFS